MAARVLLHSPYATGGGETVHVTNLAILLRETGRDVTAVVRQEVVESPEYGGRMKAAGTHLVALPNWYHWPTILRVPAFRVRLLSALRGRLFDYLIAHGTGGTHAWFRRFLQPAGLFVWHDHTSGGCTVDRTDRFQPPGVRAYEDRVIRSGKAADLVLVGSERGRENLRATQGIERPIKVLFPLQEPPSAMDVGDRNVGSGLIRIGYFGRLEPAKGIDALLNIWKRLRIGRTVLNLHGPDPEGSYQRLVHRMGLSEQVEVKGPYVQADLQMLLAETDLAVLPSLNEGNPIVIQEFMSNGVPFVMTDVGAGPELTRGCEDARLATLSDLGVIEALEEMVTRLRNGDLSRSRLRAYYERNFAYAKTRRSYLNLFREIESHIHTRE